MASDTAIKTLSNIIGWTYMLCWTASFYPQFLLNIRRRTTVGYSIDFALLNILGMTSYAIHNLVLFFSPVVRAQYARRYPRNPTPTVQPNDIAYAVHGAVITVLLYSQFYPRLWHFARIKDLRCSPWTLGFFWGSIGVLLLGAFVVGLRPTSFRWEWLDVVSVSMRPGLTWSGLSYPRTCHLLTLTDLPHGEREGLPHRGQIRAADMAQHPAQVDPGA